MDKNKYFFKGETMPIFADKDDLQELLKAKKDLLNNYEEISSDLDDELYISRGNGFATSKWAPDVIEDKICELTSQIEQINCWLKEL